VRDEEVTVEAIRLEATGGLHLPGESSTTAALRRHSNLMPITVPNYIRKTERFQIEPLIGITSES
jgi:hypothetical protein